MPDRASTLFAYEHMDPSGSVVVSAQILSTLIIERLQKAEAVKVSFCHARGLASSYFNELLGRLVATISPKEMEQRVQFEFDTTVQRTVFERSLAALRAAAA